MTPFWGEFIGTMLLLLLGDGVVAGVVLKSSKAENAGWIVITLAWGLAVTMAIYAVGGISGAHLNPAVGPARRAAKSICVSRRRDGSGRACADRPSRTNRAIRWLGSSG